MYRKILVPLDGSKRAEAILPHVEVVARRFDAEIIFLQVIEPIPVMTETTRAFDEQLVDQLSSNAESYLTGLRGSFSEKGIRARTLVTYGVVVSTILAVANGEDVDLIAMASHGRGGLSRVFYGSVAAGVLHGVDRALLLVRATNDQ